MNIELFRSYFPHTEQGRIYFNHASTGAISTLVRNAVADLLQERSESKMDEYEQFLSVLASAKKKIGAMLNCNPDRIAFLDNTSEGLNVLANSIDWQNGDTILIGDTEFPANVYPFMMLERRGVKVNFVKSANGIFTADDLINSITKSTKMITVSHVQFLSGYRIDLEKLGKVCRSENIILSVDAIQSLGALRLDVNKTNTDFISCGTQKWMLGLQGLAFIYVNEELQNKMLPYNVGWLSVKNAWNLLDYNTELKNTADRFQAGTLNTAGIYALNASLNLFNAAGLDLVEQRVLRNAQTLFNLLEDSGTDLVLSGTGEDARSGIVTFRHERAEELFNYLTNEKIHLSLREGLLRLSPHFYNNDDDIFKVVERIRNFNKS